MVEVTVVFPKRFTLFAFRSRCFYSRRGTRTTSKHTSLCKHCHSYILKHLYFSLLFERPRSCFRVGKRAEGKGDKRLRPVSLHNTHDTPATIQDIRRRNGQKEDALCNCSYRGEQARNYGKVFTYMRHNEYWLFSPFIYFQFPVRMFRPLLPADRCCLLSP